MITFVPTKHGLTNYDAIVKEADSILNISHNRVRTTIQWPDGAQSFSADVHDVILSTLNDLKEGKKVERNFFVDILADRIING
jgi:hypothetical protein